MLDLIGLFIYFKVIFVRQGQRQHRPLRCLPLSETQQMFHVEHFGQGGVAYKARLRNFGKVGSRIGEI